MSAKTSSARRVFLAKLGQSAAMAATGGLLWGFLVEEQVHAAYNVLRPPGAEDADAFYAKCIKCGQCVRDCPYDTLRLAPAGERIPIGTPYFVPREVPCYMCPDIPCKAACPTGALNPALEKIDEARMGLAVIDMEHCLSWQGLRCEICYRECPVQGKAIVVRNYPRKLSKHGMFVPVVQAEYCTGCGVCEKACPTEKASIRVMQPELIEGKIGEHYRLGWKDRGRLTEEFHPYEEPGTQEEGAAGLDYLNRGDEL